MHFCQCTTNLQIAVCIEISTCAWRTRMHRLSANRFKDIEITMFPPVVDNFVNNFFITAIPHQNRVQGMRQETCHPQTRLYICSKLRMIA